MPVYRQWPGFEVRTRQGCLSPSSASAKVSMSAHQNALLNRACSACAASTSAMARGISPSERAMRAAPSLRAVDVALHFAQRQRPLREPAVGMEHRVRRTLPAVLRRRRAARPRLDEAVAVDVAVHVDPAQRRGDRRPQLGDEIEVGGARVVRAGQQHEQRRGVDAEVVRRDVAAARLVEDLAGLGAVGRRSCRRSAWRPGSAARCARCPATATASAAPTMIASRPKTASSHGRPAAGMRPCGVAVSIMPMSAAERCIQALNVRVARFAPGRRAGRRCAPAPRPPPANA